MASRYPTIKVQDYCFSPIHVVDDSKDVYVPCGKCDGCLLHKANEWSQRVGTELEYSPNSIFFTLTYSNRFIPFLIKYDPMFDFHGEIISHFPFWYSDHLDSYRFDGKNIVRRHDNIILKDFGYECIPLTHSDFKCINYMSKRDVQLWLKNLRSDIVKQSKTKGSYLYGYNAKKDGLFRYYFISELGPTTNRSHGHGIIFCKSHEISEYLLSCGLYKNWQMCDKDRFDDYSHYCDSGARGYVTQYLTMHSKLPKVYQQNKEIRPFRLASKNPSIGYIQFDKTEVSENFSVGIDEYSRIIRRLGLKAVLKYPKDYATQLFPKCHEFGTSSFSRILFVYGCLWREVVRDGREYFDVSRRLCSVLHPMDFQAARKCYQLCVQMNICPDTYLWILNQYYYLRSMSAFRYFYIDVYPDNPKTHPYDVCLLYNNFFDVVSKAKNSIGRWKLVLDYFMEGLGMPDYSIDDLLNKDFYFAPYQRKKEYQLEVKGIIEGMVKTAKMNELLGNAPTIV